MAEGQSEEKKGPDRTMCAIMAILLGGFGVHKFMMGQTTPAIILLCCLLCCAVGIPVGSIIGLIEGIIYLTKTDEQFYQTYVVEKKAWF